MNSRNEMIPAPKREARQTVGLCGPEWRLLCWIRRELGLITLKATKAKMLSDVARILSKMDEEFTDWPEDSK